MVSLIPLIVNGNQINNIMTIEGELIKAYRQTISDFEISINECGLFDYKEQNYYKEKIKEYEDKISELRK